MLVGGWYTILLLLYSYIITIPVVHGRFAATATAAAAAADRCGVSLVSPLFGCRRGGLVVAGVILALLCVAAITRTIKLWYLV